MLIELNFETSAFLLNLKISSAYQVQLQENLRSQQCFKIFIMLRQKEQVSEP
uniref:Uncharacterized protein n=1 Tax=Candidatus Kentrum sp. LPFa TaxID=2126335 RepID=A0A450WYQ1_9GAMM|nr:MAG: hypothetical protein BECKLPF1236B_GA0070989_12964 [Candidatus Kentron sp. LPFa]